MIPADLTPERLREIARLYSEALEYQWSDVEWGHEHKYTDAENAVLSDLRAAADVLAVGEQGATSTRVGPHQYVPDDFQYAGDCRVCGHVKDDPLHAAVGEQETAPLMVTNPDGSREPWSLEWQVKDDLRYFQQRSVESTLAAGEQVEPQVPPAGFSAPETWDPPVPWVFGRMADELDADDIEDTMRVAIVDTLRHWAAASVSSPTPQVYDHFDNLIDVDYVDRTVDGENTTLMRNLIYRLWERVSSPTPPALNLDEKAHTHMEMPPSFVASSAPPTPTRAEELLERFADEGWHVAISPMVPTSPNWRVTVSRRDKSAVNYEATLASTLEVLAHRLGLAVSDAETAG